MIRMTAKQAADFISISRQWDRKLGMVPPLKPKLSRKPPVAPEKCAKKAITDYLRAEGIWCMRVNSGGIRNYRGAPAGTADLLAIIPTYRQLMDSRLHPALPRYPDWAVPLWIETKSAIGKQREAQKTFQHDREAEGCLYVLARSVEDIMAVLPPARRSIGRRDHAQGGASPSTVAESLDG